MIEKISVTSLAEFVHQRGDLFPPLNGRTRAEEGIETQRLVQKRRGDAYETERHVSAEFNDGAVTLLVSGRMDGFDPSLWLVEEIKTTRTAPELAERYLGSSHWAQVTLYAALLAREFPQQQNWLLQLTYCHPDDHSEHPLQRSLEREELEEYLSSTIETYLAWQRQQLAYRHRRDQWLTDLDFPFPSFRTHQHALARRVFQSFRDGERLLLEAPTGSGKTLGVLYPALKALASGFTVRLFYLTSRSTGARAVASALNQLNEPTRQLRSVELIAREKACAVPGTPCRSDRCDYAKGYYDRRGEAVRDLLDRSQMDVSAISEVAQLHTVCPFELSLDAALWADLIVGDYNYVLDPVVRLQRFAGDSQMGLLIDESHQLADRSRDMLSLTLQRHQISNALQESLPPGLKKRLRSLDSAVLKLRRDQTLTEERQIEAPQGVLRAISKIMQALAEENIELEAFPDTQELIFNLSRWQRSDDWITETSFAFFGASADPARGQRRNVQLRLACLDPGPYLTKVLDEYGAHVRFSGTLTPLPLYQKLHGYPQAPSERVASSFSHSQLGLFIVTDISVLYRDRTRSLSALAQLLAQGVSVQSGNYLVALPSFAYLEALCEQLRSDYPELDLLVQERSLSVAEREEFLEQFTVDSCRIGIVVLGGVFAESVDFPDGLLKGVFCVGLGLPPSEPVREAIVDRFNAEPDTDGVTVAYQLPAMQKILQMAGRLLRGPDDRGVICLIDGRFQQQQYQRFFPDHWQPQNVRAAKLAPELEKFWQAEHALPRLAAPQPPHRIQQ